MMLLLWLLQFNSAYYQSNARRAKVTGADCTCNLCWSDETHQCKFLHHRLRRIRDKKNIRMSRRYQSSYAESWLNRFHTYRFPQRMAPNNTYGAIYDTPQIYQWTDGACGHLLKLFLVRYRKFWINSTAMKIISACWKINSLQCGISTHSNCNYTHLVFVNDKDGQSFFDILRNSSTHPPQNEYQ